MQKEHPQRSLSIEIVTKGLFTRVHTNVQGFHVEGAPPKISVNRNCDRRVIRKSHKNVQRFLGEGAAPNMRHEKTIELFIGLPIGLLIGLPTVLPITDCIALSLWSS